MGFVILLILIFAAGFVHGILFTGYAIRNFEDQNDVIIENIAFAPDEKHTAITYTTMGGGAAGYCYTYLSVLPKFESDNFQKAIYNVASGKCTSEVILEWIDNRHLRVTNFKTDEQSSYNKDRTITISY